VRAALAGLTTRGRLFLTAAATAAVAALLLGESDLLRVTVLLGVLPLLAVCHVARARYKLACSRTLEPCRIPVGGHAQVILRLHNLSRIPTGTMLLEDRLPYALGSRPRLVLERLRAQQSSAVGYRVRADVRGRYDVGPLVVRLTDPFGLCELTRSFATVDPLIVIPGITALPAVRLAGEYTGVGENRIRSVAAHGEDDAATREYRHGDDLRRVHWRATAHAGELMVRREEQPWESRATVLLDTRAVGYRGEGPTASFEWAVSAAASIAVHLRQGGYRLRLVTTAQTETAEQAGPDMSGSRFEAGGEGPLLDRLAEETPSSSATVGALVERVRRRRDLGLVVGVFGLLSATEADQIGGLRAAGATCVAFLVDSTTWLSLPTQARAAADQVHEAAAATLLRRGWRVVRVPHGARLASLWPQAARGQQGFAWRAAMAETVAGGVRTP